MSLLLGTKTERLSLEAALEQLKGAASWAGRPSPLMLAGLLYPGVIDAWSFIQASVGTLPDLAGIQLDLAGGMAASWAQFLPKIELGYARETLTALVWAFPLAFVAARLSAGLALLSADQERGGLREAWASGRGHTRSTLCLWGLLASLLIGVLLVLLLPLVGLIETFQLGDFPPLLALLITPALLVLFAYAALLQIVQQLALHSLVQNKRGVSSALTHGWRLVRNAPWSAVRAASCDLGLVLLTLAVAAIGDRFLGSGSLLLLLGYAWVGFLGIVRAAFWFRVYHALGGQGQGDHLHGIGG